MIFLLTISVINCTHHKRVHHIDLIINFIYLLHYAADRQFFIAYRTEKKINFLLLFYPSLMCCDKPISTIYINILIDRQRNNVIELNSRSQLLCVVRWNVKIEFLNFFFFLLSRVRFIFQAVSCRQKRGSFSLFTLFFSFSSLVVIFSF